MKFEEEKALFSFMRRAVIDTLSKNDLVVKVNLDNKEKYQKPAEQKPNIYSSSSFAPRNDSGFTFMKHTEGSGTAKIHELFKGNESEEKLFKL